MVDGIYLVNYTGRQGIGAATMTLSSGQIVGVDVAGGEYEGTYKLQNENIVGNIVMHVPAGVYLVTGAPISPVPYTVPISFAFPAAIKVNQVIQTQIQLPTGPVNANVKKVKSLPA